MTAEIVTRLGVYMRAVGRELREHDPMDYREAFNFARGQDVGYAAAVLVRLAERGIAREIKPGGFVRGPRWNEAAMYYNWGEWA